MAGGIALLCAILTLLFQEDTRIGAAFLVFSVVAFLTLRATRNLSVNAFVAERECRTELTGFMEGHITGLEDIRANGAGAHVLGQQETLASKVIDRTVRAGLVGRVIWITTAAIFVLGSLMALDMGIYLFIERRQRIVLTGPVGAGKTTLLRALVGLLPADDGIITWNGEQIGDAASFMIPPHAAYLSQVPTLFSQRLDENIRLGVASDDEALQRVIATAMLEQDLEQLPLGLKTAVGARGVTLSGGQVQRVAAARMLLRDPELLVIDDLGNALDAKTEAALWQALRRTGGTSITVSHRR
jgi:ABC-type multidrug transport system fused ATPase/permease subunit